MVFAFSKEFLEVFWKRWSLNFFSREYVYIFKYLERSTLFLHFDPKIILKKLSLRSESCYNIQVRFLMVFIKFYLCWVIHHKVYFKFFDLDEIFDDVLYVWSCWVDHQNLYAYITTKMSLVSQKLTKYFINFLNINIFNYYMVTIFLYLRISKGKMCCKCITLITMRRLNVSFFG